MKDTELYARLLGLKHPWSVVEVKLDMDKNRVDLYLTESSGAKHPCPKCNKPTPVYDHKEEQVWRHLDTCQCETYVHARLPRTKCAEHGVHRIMAPWAGPRSGFTLLFQSKLIDTLKECDVTGATRLTKVSGDEAWRVMEKAVGRGLARKIRRVPEYIGINENLLPRGIVTRRWFAIFREVRWSMWWMIESERVSKSISNNLQIRNLVRLEPLRWICGILT